MKKIISLLSAFAMLATMAISASAATPEIKLVLNFAETGETLSDENYDPDLNFEDYYGAPVYKAELSIEGVAKKASVKEGGTTVAYTGCIVDSIQTKFAYEADSDVIIVGSALQSGALSKTTVAGEFTFSWSTATAAEMLKTDKAVIGTWYFVAEDMGAIAGMKIDGFPGYAHVGQINQYWDGTTKEETLKLAAFTPVVVAYPAAAATTGSTGVCGLPAAGNAMLNPKTGLEENTVVTSFNSVELTTPSFVVKNGDVTKTYDASYFPTNVKGAASFIAIIRYATNAVTSNVFEMELFNGETSLGTATYVAE